MLLARGGDVLAEVFAEGDEDTLGNTRSCTKTVVGMLLGIAVERGVVRGAEATLGELLDERAQLYRDALAARELFAPLDIERAEWPRTPLGATSTAGGLLLSTRSLLGLGELYRQGGRGIVPSSWIEASTRPHAEVDDEIRYGYLWWLRSFEGRASWYMSGAGGSRVHVFPELDLVAVITSANFGRRDAHDLSDRLLVEQVLPLL